MLWVSGESRQIDPDGGAYHPGRVYSSRALEEEPWERGTMIGSILQGIIKECRKRGLTQKEIAQLTGVERSTIAYMESGKHHDARFSTVMKVAQGLNLSLDKICHQEEQTPTLGRNDAKPPPVHMLVANILGVLEQYYPEESYTGCNRCLEGMCKHDTGTQFARMLREACYRLSRVRGWR